MIDRDSLVDILVVEKGFKVGSVGDGGIAVVWIVGFS